MIIANLYDEKLNDIPKAIYYYELFLDNLKTARMPFGTDYIESVKKRLDYLKNPKPVNKQLQLQKKNNSDPMKSQPAYEFIVILSDELNKFSEIQAWKF